MILKPPYDPLLTFGVNKYVMNRIGRKPLLRAIRNRGKGLNYTTDHIEAIVKEVLELCPTRHRNRSQQQT